MTGGLRAMRARDPAEPYRSASSLELLFDLVFVVAVSQASGALRHLWEEQQFAHGVTAYAMVFFAIFNAWLNFTWFASAYDTDDWLYRLTTFVQMAGALTIAAGAQRAMLDNDFRAIVIGYVIMRVAMAAQWTRAAISDPEYRGTSIRYAVGIVVVQ
ncbi:MAG TPA: low temperature requirement protein A, partial [Mycobacterium sp.]|nr:low temperature requirement protein A [Mycobacterium sp.]